MKSSHILVIFDHKALPFLFRSLPNCLRVCCTVLDNMEQKLDQLREAVRHSFHQPRLYLFRYPFFMLTGKYHFIAPLFQKFLSKAEVVRYHFTIKLQPLLSILYFFIQLYKIVYMCEKARVPGRDRIEGSPGIKLIDLFNRIQ